MAKKKRQREADSVYFLKVILFFILGSIWIRFSKDTSVPGIPIGLILAIMFASHDHFMIDKKVEFAVALGAAVLAFVAPIGATIVV